MIPLAQYLTEFDEQDGTPFAGRKSPAPHPRRPRQPEFEHLMLVASRAFDPDPSADIVPFPLIALPEMALPEDAATTARKAVPAPARAEPADADAGQDEGPDEAAAVVAGPSQEELLEAAREEARAEARAAAEAEHQAALAEALRAEREKAAAEQAAALEAARAEWAKSEGERLAGLFDERLDRIETVVHSSLASVLRPIALDARRRQTVMELAGAVRTLTLDGAPLKVRASGPADLLDALAAQLGSGSAMVAFTPDKDGVDVRIECDQTVIETRLAGWRTALEEALA
ncbi:hypothetical protein GTW51_03380 [Aurantimonas aggregata]|uniref:Uncharacterized protein n=1 Tax=Aurantimonas aggregata TaxID=2047720 RepID=A0A6L9MDK3_9HYPH|nr:hypothetical protein [Aurantimonas aggregata]NDV85738.1 hypothetical protein [Aurantimonas aggregata]